MAPDSRYSTPGVYIQETSTSQQIAQVETAIPAFIGYTEKSPGKNVPLKIKSLLEFEENFGGAYPEKVKLTIRKRGGVHDVAVPTVIPKYTMHYQMRLFFANGGGPCYIVSVGVFSNVRKSKTALLAGIRSIKKIDEATLLVLADAPTIGHNELNKALLAQAATAKDRLAIIDIPESPADPIGDFRNAIGTNNLSYGAAYYPRLITKMRPHYEDASVLLNFRRSVYNRMSLSEVKKADQPLYEFIKKKLESEISAQSVTLFPSGAVAGIYCATDERGGVWKAPANISISEVHAPEVQISSAQQESLNVDPVAGKSVNAIRSFSGKGVLVWGARTLAGNDNEWRYVSVRRFCINVEESIKKALLPYVFEPNDANTWARINVLISNYLTEMWRNGALAGAKPEHAFFVNVGLGKTMTAQDVLQGRLIVEIGLAVVRPAEFIVLQFANKMQP